MHDITRGFGLSYRQVEFIDMLSAMRLGKLEDWHIEEFVKLRRVVEYSDGISPTELCDFSLILCNVRVTIEVHRFPLKGQVEYCNRTRLEVLPGEELTYSAMDSRGFDMHRKRIPVAVSEQLLERLVVPRVISLRVGCDLLSG